MDITRKTSKHALLCCRACLLTDCKLYDIHENNLADTFSRVSGTPVFKDKMPQHVCAYCLSFVMKCTNFRETCLRSQQCLLSALLEGEVDTERVRRIDRPTKRLNLSLTKIHVIDHTTSSLTDLEHKTNNDVDIDNIVEETEVKTEIYNKNDEVKIDEDTDTDFDLNDFKSTKKKTELEVNEIIETTDDKDEINYISLENTTNVKIEIEMVNDEISVADNDDNGFSDTESDDSLLKKENKRKNIKATRKKKKLREDDYDDDDNSDTENDNSPVEKENKRKTIGVTWKKYSKKVREDDNNDDSYTENDNSPVKTENKRETIRVTRKKYYKKVIEDDNDDDSDTENDNSLVKTENRRNTIKVMRKKGSKKVRYDDDDTDTENDNSLMKKENKRKTVKDKKKSYKGKKSKNNSDDADAFEDESEKGRKRKKVFRDPANDYLPIIDYDKYANDYGMEIVTLSKDEQLEEIASRKKSRIYLNSRFKCAPCGKGYITEAAYNNHQTRHNPSDGAHVCDICGVRFKKLSRMRMHQVLHRFKFICKECNYVSRTSVTAKIHHAMHAGETFDCEHCERSFNKRTTYLGHLRLTHPAMNVACDMCGETFIGQRGLALHQKKTHGKLTKPQQFKCKTCSVKFNSVSALNTHTDTAGEHGDLRPCEQCGENCASEDALREHVEEKHPIESHRCEECNMTFPTTSTYEVHHRRKHLNQRFRVGDGAEPRKRGLYVKREKLPPRVPRPRGPQVCDQCGKILPSAAKLRIHQHFHLEVKPHPCPHCPKTFATRTILEFHLRIHTGEKPFQCPLCPSTFRLRTTFTRHHKTVHLNQRDECPCSVCGHVFTTRSSAKSHAARVHGGAPWPKQTRKKRKPKSKDTAVDNKLLK
ncbi:zinc finger protein with KRAB and SCAN domains 7-like [Cydia strobilella]|uniref:zinc finger protein with KRAB and SCAN domains 7-like n=1 Tax=Cydia strobilella TaxID=1100964 RepID=UPI003004C56E